MSQRVLFYTLYERIWHWSQALGIILLIVSGFQIHYPRYFPVFGDLAIAVLIHNIIGIALLINGLLGLFHSLTTNKMREVIPMPMDFSKGAFEQAKYYVWGIFHKAPHPFEKSTHKKLNPLQKITYFFLLTLLLPLQIVTGMLMWSATVNPEILEQVGGLKLIGPIHTAGAFLFLSFLITHIYLSTTGHTPLEYLKQMITGYGDAPLESDSRKCD